MSVEFHNGNTFHVFQSYRSMLNPSQNKWIMDVMDGENSYCWIRLHKIVIVLRYVRSIRIAFQTKRGKHTALYQPGNVALSKFISDCRMLDLDSLRPPPWCNVLMVSSFEIVCLCSLLLLDSSLARKADAASRNACPTLFRLSLSLISTLSKSKVFSVR